MAKDTVKTLKPAVQRSTDGLRDALFEALDGLRNGVVDVHQVKATVNVSNAVLQTVRADLDAAKVMHELGYDTTAETLQPGQLTFQARKRQAGE